MSNHMGNVGGRMPGIGSQPMSPRQGGNAGNLASGFQFQNGVGVPNGSAQPILGQQMFYQPVGGYQGPPNVPGLRPQNPSACVVVPEQWFRQTNKQFQEQMDIINQLRNQLNQQRQMIEQLRKELVNQNIENRIALLEQQMREPMPQVNENEIEVRIQTGPGGFKTMTLLGQPEEIREGQLTNENVNKVVFPSSVQRICCNAFKNWRSLQCVEFQTDSRLSIIQNGAFSGTGLVSLQTPPGLRIIGKGAFARCRSLCQVQLNEGLTQLQTNCFEDCDLGIVGIPGSVQKIDYRAFFNCKNLASVTFKKESCLSFIAAQAFYGTHLDYVEIPHVKKSNIAFAKNTVVKYME